VIRQAVKLIAILILLASALSAPAAAKQNILLIIADDYGVDSSSLYNTNTPGASATLPPTPNIASLATNGVVFRNCYANPVCSPTRACILTGQHGFRTGVGDIVDFGPSLTTSSFTLPKAFTNAALGYSLAQFGKWHLASGPNSPRTVGGWTNFAGSLIGAIANYTNWNKTVNGVNNPGYTNYATTDLVNEATNFITSKGTNAWFVWAAFNAPHTPFHNPPQSLCPSYPLNTLTNSRQQFEAMVEALDTEIGRLLSVVDRANTHIIFIGDNGTPGSVIAPPYVSSRGKDTLYEGGIHVPLVISGPAVLNPNRTNYTPVNAVDLFATILEMAGSSAATAVPTNVTLDSQSLMGQLAATNAVFRLAYAEEFGTNVTASAGGRALRDDRYKLIRFSDGRDEFYDLQTDPTELTNLNNSLTVEQKAYRDRLQFWMYRYTTNSGITIAVPQLNSGQFSCRVTNAASYALWRCNDPATQFWSPVTNAFLTTNGAVVTLTDPTPPADRAFYSVVK
jgi:arylsulfatase A-like enzyme